MENLPLYISIVFITTTLLTLFFLYRATASKTIAAIAVVWLVIQAFISLSGFYTDTKGLPPHFILLTGPPLLFILILFLHPRGRKLIDTFNPEWLSWLHIVRVPVEIVLFWLFLSKQIPQLMTFDGRNFDIFSGITAPFIAWLGYRKPVIERPVLLLWNIVCLGLLLNIVINAVLAAPFPFQQFAFDQPNVAVLYFPFVWLPGFIVPVVLLSHLVCIRQLLLKEKKNTNVDNEI